MEVPNLRITVLKGPKEGETLDKKPGTKLRIGRIVKGNNFTIKDDGISSNHLLIEVKDLSWVISDLDTSNGTFLNGVQIEPNSPNTLKDGDFIKIGEFTSMKVSFGEEKKEKPKQTKKIGKTKGSESSVSVADDIEDVKENGGAGAVPVRRYPTRGAAAVNKQQVQDSNLGSKVETRRGRGRGNKKVDLGNEKVETVVDSVAEVNIRENSQSAVEVIVSVSSEVIGGNSSKGKEVVDSPKVEVGDSSKGDNVGCDDIPEKSTNEENSTNEEKMTLEKLNKMTLGEWFDYLEVYLVKQINKETDEIVDGMRAKAEEFKKFMSEQQKLKKKTPVS